MGIKYYGSGEHPEGFVGFRVTRSYRNQYFQQYFSTRDARSQCAQDFIFRSQKLKAELRDAEWLADSLWYQYRRYVTENHPSTKPGRGVGVHGITASFFLDKRKKWQAAFVVAKSQDGSVKRRGARQFTFCAHLYSEAWRNAVKYWASEHDILDEDRDRLLAAAPPPELFKLLRRHMNEQDGADIPTSTLSNVFREQREKLSQKSKSASTVTTAQLDVIAWFEREQARLAQ